MMKFGNRFAASVFGEQRRLEPMSADRKARWKKEIDWLLSVTDHIVEFVPLQQTSEDGTSMEVTLTPLTPIGFCSTCHKHCNFYHTGDGHPAAQGHSHEHPRLAKTRRDAPRTQILRFFIP